MPPERHCCFEKFKGARDVTDEPTPKRWEYIVIQYVGSLWSGTGDWDHSELEGFSTEQMLNHYGAQGWELVNVGPVHDQSGKPAAAYMLKRPL